MSELTELCSAAHGQLRVAQDCALEKAQHQHLVNLRVAELGKAVSTFPVFATRVSQTGRWALSAVCSFTQGENLFVREGNWDSLYLPTAMQTYPLYLMHSPDSEGGYTVGIEEGNPAFSETRGESLFDANGKASLYLSRVTTLLEADIKNDIQTHQFALRLEELNMFRGIEVLVYFEDDSVQTIKGLHTLDEDRLQFLTAEELLELNNRGYLVAMHAMLLSIHQLNALIRRHNQQPGAGNVRQIKLEAAKGVVQ